MVLADDLRKAVLQAAIQGKLVPQNSKDDPASVLLERIKDEKEYLIKEKKIKKGKSLEPISEDEIPFDIPDSWEWTNIETCCINITYGTSQKSSPTGKMPVIRMGNIQNGRIDYSDLVYSNDDAEILKYPLEYDDLLFNRTNSKQWVGKTAIYKAEKSAIYAGYLIRITPLFINSDYLNYVMQSSYYKAYCWAVKGDGVDQSNINAEKLKAFCFPIPPLKEQQRIVAKIEELMKKINEFKGIEVELESIKKAFPDDMKKSLLQAAIQGKLTEQLPTDSSVDELLDKIKEEKERLIIEKKIKKEKALKPISDGEIPFDIPENWRWVKIESIIAFIGSKNNQIQQKDINEYGKFPVISQSQKYIAGYNDDEKKLIYLWRDVIVFGDHTTEIKYVDFDFIIGADGVKVMCPICISAKYLTYVLRYNTLGMEKVGGYSRHYKFLKDKPVPLPPLEEQHRIVEKLEKLLPCCEELVE